MTPVKIHEYRGFNINIYTDDMAMDPREESDPMGHMVCFHSRYMLGDKHDFNNPDELMEYLEEIHAQWLPLFLYDHSGITINTTGFSCPWDSGQVGIIYMTMEEIEREYPIKDYPDQIERAHKYMKGEVETYDYYLTGDVYGYTIEPKDTNKNIDCDDSCWGFYGYDSIKYILSEHAEPAIDYAIEKYKETVIKDKKERVRMNLFIQNCWAY